MNSNDINEIRDYFNKEAPDGAFGKDRNVKPSPFGNSFFNSETILEINRREAKGEKRADIIKDIRRRNRGRK